MSANNTLISRRDFAALAAAPIAALSAPAMAQAQGESLLRPLFHRWQKAKAEYAALPDGCEQDLEFAFYEEISRLEQSASNFEPQTVEDVMFKIIFADCEGQMDANTHQTALVAEAYKLAGITPNLHAGAAA